jgi:hypothetical protein
MIAIQDYSIRKLANDHYMASGCLGFEKFSDKQFMYYKNPGAYGARTRNLRRDRAAL